MMNEHAHTLKRPSDGSEPTAAASTPNAGAGEVGHESNSTSNKRHKTSTLPPAPVTAAKPPSRRTSSAFITLCVGDRRFKTSRATLALAGGMYFSALLSNRWAEGEAEGEGEGEGGFDEESEIFIDRDPEPFAVILSFLRSGGKVLNIDEGDRKLFTAVLVEADFYQVEILINTIKLAIQRNICDVPTPRNETEAQSIAQFDKKFPSLIDVAKLRVFPECFWRRAVFNRIISVDPLPADSYVEFALPDGCTRFLPATHSVTWENLWESQVCVEPLVMVDVGRKTDWVNWCTPYCFCRQFLSETDTWGRMPKAVPASYAIKVIGGQMGVAWHMASRATITCSEAREMGLKYTTHEDGKPVDNCPELCNIFLRSQGVSERNIIMYGISFKNKIMDATTFSNFLHVGEKTAEDVALAAAQGDDDNENNDDNDEDEEEEEDE